MARKDVTNDIVSQDMEDSNDNFIELYAFIAAIAAGSGIVITVDDETVGPANTKFLEGPNMTFTINNPGGAETMTFSVTTLDAALDAADQVVQKPKFLDVSETLNTIGDTGGGTDDIDLESGNVVSATVSTAEQTFTFSNPPATGSNGSFVLFLTNGGSQVVNWPASVDWVSATAPTLTAAGVDVLVFTTNDAGTLWSGFVVGLDVS